MTMKYSAGCVQIKLKILIFLKIIYKKFFICLKNYSYIILYYYLDFNNSLIHITLLLNDFIREIHLNVFCIM